MGLSNYEGSLYDLYDTEEFNKKYIYTGELGAVYEKNKTIFRVWSPISYSVKLRIYENGTPVCLEDLKHKGTDSYQEYPMELKDKGVWEYTLIGDYAGKYYTYVITNRVYQDKEVVDPYAKSCGINGLRGMVVDFSKTNPEGWESIKPHEILSQHLTVYETHIADLTSSKSWNGKEEYRKNFKGFYEEGTTYTKNGRTVRTGFDHIKELGVNAVQLIPIFDAHNDERIGKRKFNWGYDPVNYNSLDGIYSLNPYDGYERIKEFKGLVYAYNKAGMNIIMDVVFNHMNDARQSNFDIIMPEYYFRYQNGVMTDGSACGNETASNRPMYRKFMIDSTKFWASEYKLGGFRFDLMGLHDIKTMTEIANTLHKEVSEYITVYGEPWAGGQSPLPKEEAAMQANLAKFGDFGQFNDKIRDALIKGGLHDDDELGFVTNNKEVDEEDIKDIKNGILGITGYGVKNPAKSVMYVTCHDNYTLFDRIQASGTKDFDTVKKMAVLANSVVFSTQGIAFMLSGEEFLRTKNGNPNSYNTTYEENELNYELKVNNYDVFEIYQKLIALKQKTSFFGKTAIEIEKDITIMENEKKSIISYKVMDRKTNQECYVIHKNGILEEITLDLSNYELYLSTLGTTKEEVTSGSYLIKPYESLILFK